MPESRFGLPLLYLAIFLLALTGLFAKLIPLDAVSIIHLRGVVAAAALLLFARVRLRPLRLTGPRVWGGVYALGLVLGVHWVTFFHAMQVSSVAVGMLAMFSFPVITILLEPLFTGQRLQARDLLAGVVTLAGLAVMAGQDQAEPVGSVAQGVFWGVVSAVLFSLRNLFQKYRFPLVPSDSLMFHQVVAVALMLGPFADWHRVSALAGADAVKIVLLGIFCTAGAHTLLVFCLKRLLAKSVALISCLQPVIATLLAWIVVKEVPGYPVVLGGGLVLAVAAYESLKKLGEKP